MGDSQQPKLEPARRSVIIIVAVAAVLVLGGICVLLINRNHSPDVSGTSESAAEERTAASPSSPNATPTPQPAREVIASAPVSAVPPVVQPQTAPEASPYARQLVNALVQLNMTNGPLTAEKLAAWQQAFQQLTNAGPAAVPAIREFLQTKQDTSFDSIGTSALGEPSLRVALLDALAKIGGSEAVAVSADTLRSTTNPREIATLARNLEQLAPGEYRTAAVDAARAALAEAASGKLPGSDVAALFTVLQQYAGAEALQDFQNASGRWSYYSAIALGGLHDGAGIQALTQMAQPDSANRNSRSAALQVLAQLAPDSVEARAAFLEQAKTDLPAATWIKIGSLLSGEQLQIGNRADTDVPEAAVKSTYKMPNQTFFTTSVLERLTSDQLTQRIQLIDQILAATQQPAAVDALQRARTTLLTRAQSAK